MTCPVRHFGSYFSLTLTTKLVHDVYRKKINVVTFTKNEKDKSQRVNLNIKSTIECQPSGVLCVINWIDWCLLTRQWHISTDSNRFIEFYEQIFLSEKQLWCGHLVLNNRRNIKLYLFFVVFKIYQPSGGETFMVSNKMQHSEYNSCNFGCNFHNKTKLKLFLNGVK